MKSTNNAIAFTRNDVVNAIAANTTGAIRTRVYSYDLVKMSLDEPAWILYSIETGYHEVIWGNELNVASRWVWLNGVRGPLDLYRVFPDGNAYLVLRHE